jgi:helicase-like protein
VQDRPEEAPADARPDGVLKSTVPSPFALRALLEEAVVNDLRGPAGGAEEEVDEAHVNERYLVGMLAPKRLRVTPETFDPLEVEDAAPEDGPVEPTTPQADTLFPSSFGFSFCVAANATALQVTARWGRYERVKSETLTTPKTGEPKMVWQRRPMEGIWPELPLREGSLGPYSPCEEQPEVVIRGQVRRREGLWIVTLFLVNEQEEKKRQPDQAWIFQPELVVEAPDGSPVFCRKLWRRDSSRLDPVTQAEQGAMAMLYRRHVEFAVGHGVAVHAETPPSDPLQAVRLSTCVVPTYELPRQTPPTEEDNPDLAGLVLDMKELAEAPPGELGGKLHALPAAYGRWINRERAKLDDPDEEGLAECRQWAEEALKHCEHSRARIEEGLALLEREGPAAAAFRFANRAMWLQRTRSLYSEAARRGGTPEMEEIDVPQNRTWYPFQLAFLLLNLPGLTNLHHPDRTGVADLLWFPTGGGKTEAYLGLAAYTLGLRRLQGMIAGHPGDNGVAVLMRYTLRLLTLQQFQRATALLCACETIRREALERGEERWGREPFRIGLWVGMRTTPNTTDQSAEALKTEHGHYRRATAIAGSGSPVQLTSCPWCGSAIVPGRDLKVESYGQGQARTLTYCGDTLGRCLFSQRRSPGEGLPVVVVDEEIYRRLPSLLIATVDKFAQMPWKGETGMLFGVVNGRCPRHGFRSPEIEDAGSHPRAGAYPAVRSSEYPPLRPPDLIIQDELHLISGPLGTLVGLYETAVDELCSWEVDGKKVRPKVVASTATIRRAGEQVQSLFIRKVEVFPPHGTEAGDNFFSLRREPGPEQPGRRYLGICAPGKRLKAALIRVYVAFMAAAQQLYEREGVAADPWMTLVGYFNSMRELGGMRRLVDDDIRTRLRETDRRGLAARKPPYVRELTSRIGATDIPEVLDLLEVRFDPVEEKRRLALRKEGRKVETPDPVDVLLATNMISVGVDVRRLGLMVVAGQPKTTAEYIQATSRVGRSAPGLVCTVFNWARPRDLSHYETFEHYHATFYQHVEALSVTPFAPRALDRGLAAVLVSLVRLAGEEYNENPRAAALDRQHPYVQRAVEAIVARAQQVTGSNTVAAEVRQQLQALLDDWGHQALRPAGGGSLYYQEKRGAVAVPLLQKPGLGGRLPFTCLNSLRDVEPSVSLVLDDRWLDDEAPAAAVVAPTPEGSDAGPGGETA